MSGQAIMTGSEPGEQNSFLSPILARWQAMPTGLLGVFYDGEEWREVRNAEFMQRTLQFSALFQAQGIAANEIILLVLEHGVDAHAAFIAAMLVGAIPGLMPSPSVRQDAEIYWRQHRQVFSHTKPRAILVYDALIEAVTDAASGSGATVFGAAMADKLQGCDLGPLPPASAIALLQHSSGTTGLKKGVQLSYQAIADQLFAYSAALELKAEPQPRIASWLPLYHDMGLISSFLLPVWAGIPILSIDPFEWTREPSLLFDAIQEFHATHCWVPNFALLHHVKTARTSRRWDLASIKAIICCSEPNKPEAFDIFVDRFADFGITAATLQTCYAMAETVFAVTQSRLGVPVRRVTVGRDALQTHGLVTPGGPEGDVVTFLSNGLPIRGCQVRVLKDDANVGENVVGEIVVSAPFLFGGYYNNSDASEKVLHDGWLRTGDLGFLNQGEVFIVGRLKDIIIVNGKNIVAHDVEAAVSRVPGVKPGRAVAFGRYLASLGSEQLVVVAESLQADGDAGVISRLINNAVSRDVGVACGDVRLVDNGWLVKTTSGKISRSENLRKYIEHFVR